MKVIAAIVCALALAGLLAGCETRASAEYERIEKQLQVATAESKSCSAKAEASAPFQALKDKLPQAFTEVSMEKMTNGAKPTKAEAQLLLEYHRDHVVPCRQAVLEALTGVPKVYASALSSGYAEADAAYARLIMRQSSWGEYATALRQVRASTNDK